MNDKSKNKISDEEIKGVKLRFQNVEGLPTKELRKLVDKGKKELGEGIIIVFANQQDKVCLLYTSPSPRDGRISRMPSSA